MSATPVSPGALVIHSSDDVAVLLQPVSPGETVVATGAVASLELRSDRALPVGHKIALRPLPAGSAVRKYGEVIGRLTSAVAPGEHVHVHNLVSLRGIAADSQVHVQDLGDQHDCEQDEAGAFERRT